MSLFESMLCVEKEIDDKIGLERLFERSWNLEYLFSISLTIDEAKAIVLAMKDIRKNKVFVIRYFINNSDRYCWQLYEKANDKLIPIENFKSLYMTKGYLKDRFPNCQIIIEE